MTPQIVYEDESLLVVNKPAGWIVNKADTTTNQPVLEDWIASHFEFPIFANSEMRHGIVHRLDKPTSGILLVAKTENVFVELQRQFKDREIHKEYLALVHGEVQPRKGKINAPVGRLPWNRERFGVLPGGRSAETDYYVIQNYKNKLESYTLVAFIPRTGRTHQLRIHAKYIRYPIVSDTFYAGRKTARKDLKWCPRLFLHAFKITFKHPDNGELITLEASLPLDLESALSVLEKTSTSQ